MVNQSVTVQFSLHEASADGQIVFQETQTTTTNGQGLFSLTFGAGVPSVGTFASINWGSGYKFLQVQANFGSGNVELGTQQLMSVPYALYAGNSGNTNNQNNSNYYPSADSTLTVTDGTRLTNGNYQVPIGERWLIESVNVNDGATSVNLTGTYSHCATVGTIYNYFCFYNTTLSNLEYTLFSIPGINVKLNLPDTFNNYGGYYTFDCNTCPPVATATAPPSFNNSNFASVNFPIWLNQGEFINVAQGVYVTITKYK
jgi:hypothetical protein